MYVCMYVYKHSGTHSLSLYSNKYICIYIYIIINIYIYIYMYEDVHV